MTSCHAQITGSLTDAELTRITGAKRVTVLRRRQRSDREVLHVCLRDGVGRDVGQGAIWLFAGDKARRVARRHPASVVDPQTNALFDRFPADHRLPEIACFLCWIVRDAPADQRAASPPVLLRYRPGLSCTFEITRQTGKRVYTKIIAKDDIMSLASHRAHLVSHCAGRAATIARPIGVLPEFRAITYERAEGRPLHAYLRDDAPDRSVEAVRRVVVALASFPAECNGLTKSLSVTELQKRASKAYEQIARRGQAAAKPAREILDRVGVPPPHWHEGLVHGDMKTDHVFLTECSATFIDTESMAVGDRRYDLACLEASLMTGVIKSEFSGQVLADCRGMFRAAAGPGYDWFLDIARLGMARHFAVRPGHENLAAITAALEL